EAHGELADHLHEADEQALADAELDAILAPESEELTVAKQSSSGEDDEEFIFQDNPEEDSAEDRYTGLRLNADELSDSFRDLDRPTQTAFADDADTELERTDSDESWAEEMLEEIEGRKPARPIPDPVQTSTNLHASANLHASDTREFSFGLEPEQEPLSTQQDAITPLAAFDRLKYDPIRVENEGAKAGSLVRVLAWTLVNILLLLAVSAQLGWFHIDRVAQHEGLRSLYAEACQRLGCTLPTLLDIDKIKSNNLVVRSHPEAGKALVIDVMVTNEAPFDQPFPNITFQFADLNGKPVAQRVFTPEEYLSGEFKELKLMPSDRPVHLTLEILDPGSDAVNYTMGFSHPPSNS